MFGIPGYNQIQSWPSPKIWEGHKLSIRTLPDFVTGNLVLTKLVNVVPLDNSVSDSFTGFLNLTKWDNGGPAGDRTLTDATNANLANTLFINYVAVDDSVTDTSNANLALTAMMSPTVSGDRTLQDDTNGFLALTKWQQ